MRSIAFYITWFVISLLTGVLLVSCSKNGGPAISLIKGAGSDTLLTDTSFYTDLTVDGMRVFYIDGREGCNMYTGGGDSLLFVGITSDSNTNPALGYYYNTSFLEFENIHFPVYSRVTDSGASTFNEWLLSNYSPGPYGYHEAGSTLSAQQGIELVWTDQAGMQWNTARVGQPAESNFLITDSQPLYNNSGYLYGVNITATFSCQVYDLQGHAKQLSRGRLRLGLRL